MGCAPVGGGQKNLHMLRGVIEKIQNLRSWISSPPPHKKLIAPLKVKDGVTELPGTKVELKFVFNIHSYLAFHSQVQGFHLHIKLEFQLESSDIQLNIDIPRNIVEYNG